METKKIKPYYIAYFDILGYKDFIKDEKIDEESFLQSNIRLAQDFAKKTLDGSKLSGFDWQVKMFSDNFIMMLESDEKIDEYQVLKSVSVHLSALQLRFLKEYKILIRGAITKGDGYIDKNIVFGEGIIRAVELEATANFPRIIIDKEKFSEQLFDGICDGCVRKDNDDEYYLDLFSVIERNVEFDKDFDGDVEKYLTELRKNIHFLVKNYGKYHWNVKDINKIRNTEKTITKYAWLLIKFNQYCQDYFPHFIIKYKPILNKRLMKFEIHVIDE